MARPGGLKLIPGISLAYPVFMKAQAFRKRISILLNRRPGKICDEAHTNSLKLALY